MRRPKIPQGLRSSLLFTGIFTVGLAALTTLIYLNPPAALVSKGSTGAGTLRQIDNLIDNCHFTYTNCGYSVDPLATLNLDPRTAGSIRALAKTYDINPQVLITLEVALADPSPVLPDHLPASARNQDRLSQVAAKLSQIIKSNQLSHVPTIHNHQEFGPSHLNQLSAASYYIVEYLGQSQTDPSLFNRILTSPDPNNPQITGFVEIYQTLFTIDPRNPN